MASNYILDSYGDYNDNLQNNAIHKYKELTDYNQESTSSFGTVLQDQLEEELDTMSDLNFYDTESLVENNSSSINLLWTNEDLFHGTVNTLGQTAVENSHMTVPLTLETETTNTNAESWTDRDIVDYSHDNTNESYQSEWWEYDKPAVLPFEEVFTNSNKGIVETTSPTVASNDKGAKLDEKTTKTTKSKTTKKSNQSDKSKKILENKIELSNDFLETKFTEVQNHNAAIGSFIERFCPGCNKTIPKTHSHYFNKECQDCGSLILYKCLSCNEYFDSLHGTVYDHIRQSCNPSSTFYCVECNFKTSRLYCIRTHLKYRHSTINKPTLESETTSTNKDMVDTTSPTVASNDNANKRNEKTTKTTKSKTTMKSDLSAKSQMILKEEWENEIELSNDFLDTKFTKVKNHNTAVSSLIRKFCSECGKTISKGFRRDFNRGCQDCGHRILYKCLNCNEYLNPAYNSVYRHIQLVCKPTSTFYCVECNFKTARQSYRRIHFKLRHSTINKL